MGIRAGKVGYGRGLREFYPAGFSFLHGQVVSPSGESEIKKKSNSPLRDAEG